MSPEELFDAFLNEDILAERKDNGKQFSSYWRYVGDALYVMAGMNGQMDRVAGQADIDNDGEVEFLMNGSYGYDCYDCKDGKVVLFAGGRNTAEMCRYTYYKDNVWIEYGDTSHGGRNQYCLYRFDGNLNVVEGFYLADWWLNWLNEDEKEVHEYYYEEGLSADESGSCIEEYLIPEEEYNRIYEEVFRPEVARRTFCDFLRDGYKDWDEDFAKQMGVFSESEYSEYLCLDLDGDHVDELLIRDKEMPGVWNFVFHYDDGEIECWHGDAIEARSVDYPLLNSTMVSEYTYADAPSRKIYRFLPDGSKEEIIRFFSREVDVYKDGSVKCPYYEINGIEVDKDEYYEKFNAYIENQRIPDSMWAAVN